jgi:hypothetical protein
VGEAFAQPTHGDSVHELSRELARLVGRERARAFIERTVEAAGVDLSPGQAWLLVQGKEGIALHHPEAIAADRPIEAAQVRMLLAELHERALVRDSRLTEAGDDTAERLIVARRERLTLLVADWEADDDPRLNEVIARLAVELGAEPPR